MKFDMYRNIVLKRGSTNKERILYEKKRSFEEYLNRSPNAYEIIINDKPIKVIIQDVKFNDNSTDDKYLLCGLEHDINVGDYIVWQDMYWLIKAKEVETIQAYQSFKMGKCNNKMKFQDIDTLEVYEIPCILQDKTSVYSDGVLKSQYFYLADDQILIIVPNNNITGKITKNQRFIFNHDMYSVYEVTKIDKLTNVGLINIVLKNVVYDENRDNLELNLSDYIEPNEDTNEDLQPVDDYRIEISGEDTIVYNWSEIYTATVYDANGKVVDVEVQFEVVGDDSYAWIENQTSNRCTVRAGSQYGVSVVLRAILVDNPDIYTDKEISIVMW